MTAASKYAETMQIDTTDRDKLIEDMLIHVRYIARRIHERVPQHVPFDDLVQAGTIGLMDAVQKYDPAKNTQFKTYAKFRIRGAILDSLRDCDWAPRDLRRQARQIEQAQTKLRNQLGHTPTDEETAAPYAPEKDPFFLCAQSEMKEILTAAIEDLPKKERDVMVLYYYEELTLKEVGAVLGVVESRVSQLRSAAILRLRSRMQELMKQPKAPPAARFHAAFAKEA